MSYSSEEKNLSKEQFINLLNINKKLIGKYFCQQALVWKPVILVILKNAPNKSAVFKKLENFIFPVFWSGSKAETLRSRFSAVESLLDHENIEIAAWANKTLADLNLEITQAQE